MLKKANRLDDQADYLDLTFIIGKNNRLYTKLYDKRDVSSFTLSAFHSSQVTYQLALHTFHSLSKMQDAAHSMMTLDMGYRHINF